MAIDYKKFDKQLFEFLQKQPQKFGDISHIANKFINGDLNNKAEVIRQLYYLRDRNFIAIADSPEDPMQLQGDWWGTLQGHNTIAGYKVEDLKAQLSTEYEKLSWWDKNKNVTKLLDWTIPTIIGYLLGLATCNVSQNNKILPTKTDTVFLKSELKGNAPNISYDSLLHNKNIAQKTLTFNKDTPAIK